VLEKISPEQRENIRKIYRDSNNVLNPNLRNVHDSGHEFNPFPKNIEEFQHTMKYI
jgi:hypothetical protein